MKVDIVSPGTYTYGSLVLGGVLRDKGHDVKITSKLHSQGDVVLLSLFSTMQLLDPKIREFVAAKKNVYVGGPVGLCPEMILGELDARAVVTGEGRKSSPIWWKRARRGCRVRPIGMTGRL